MRLGGWILLGMVVGMTEMRSAVTEAGAELKLVADGFDFTEGPSPNDRGEVFFTDQPNDRILKVGLDGAVTEFLRPSGRANGTCFDAEGMLWVCADEKNELWRVAPDGSHEVVVRGYGGALLNGPNDVWVMPGGGIYVTDPLFKRDYWKRAGTSDQPVEGLYYLAPGATELVLVDGDLQKPNGLIASPDGRTLYVADMGARTVFAYDVEEGGGLTNRRPHCETVSDGMTLDNEGNLYATGTAGVSVFGPGGNLIETIPVPQSWTANVTFGGPERDRLFITAGTGIYSIQMRVRAAGW